MKPRKTFAAILAGNRNVRFVDLVRLAEAFGFTKQRISGSHHVMKHPTAPSVLSLQPDRSGNAKAYQVRELLGYVEDFKLTLEER